ncbi:CSC1-like protein At1g32090 isoform X1 [Diospyros lotus]|uniref:CSC1-like protein At1g32090 isoform X1 n=2 Tax=Diospyros lotus TaxID=55363 RepID=UPI002255A68D|nr:CSC1-like protein At1g32090 isoform X1 [Diospyros lotus]
MATLEDIGVSAFINIVSAFAFLLAFALLRIQPINDRVYFPKWYINGARSSPRQSGNFVSKFVNLNFRTYLTFLNWMPQALKMSESEIISHAGLDSAVFLRIYILGLKIFGPIAIVALIVLIPVNVSGGTLFFLSRELVVSNIDKLSISNVHPKSIRFFVHISMEYLFTFWTCFMLYKEYDKVASMRLKFLASQHRRAEQFTVLVRNVPHVSGHSISDSVDNFFKTNHPDHYLCHQAVYNANKFAKLVRKRERLQNWLDYSQLKFERHQEKRPTQKRGFLGLCGERVDSIDFYKQQITDLDRRLTMERQRILKDPKSIMPAAFVSFNSRWGAAVCAQTQQSKNPTLWLTNWAPEPRDVYWKNLAIPFVALSIRKLVISLSVFALVFFYMIPIAFVQSLANLEGLERVAPFLRSLIEMKFIKSFLQGFLPGLALKIFLYILPTVLMIMSKIEGHISLSILERRTAAKYYYFMLVNVFLGSIAAGTAFQQLHSFLHQSPTEIPRTIGVSIPMKATFFITYIMVDGWAGIAGEILRLKPLVIYHLKNMFLVKTERDREKAMNPGSVDFPETLPSLQLYFLLGLVYAVVTPILLPFILVFFAFAYFVYRHQVINVYNQQYESVAAFWPHVHSRIIGSLLISQLLLLGLLSTKKAANSTPLLVALPVLTLAFHKYCKNRFEPAFRRHPLEDAMAKDLQERASEPNLNLKSYLSDAYLHPIFLSFEEVELTEVKVEKNQTETPGPSADRNNHHILSPPSETSSPSPIHKKYLHEDQPNHTVYHYQDQPSHTVYHYEDQPSYVAHPYDDQPDNTVPRYDVEQAYNFFHYRADESPSNVFHY